MKSGDAPPVFVGLGAAVLLVGWKLAPLPVVVVPVVAFLVVVVFFDVTVGWTMVVLRCIIVPVPMLAAVPLVVVIVMFALRLSVICFGTAKTCIVPCCACRGADGSCDGSLNGERAEVVHLAVLPSNGSTHALVSCASHFHTPNL